LVTFWFPASSSEFAALDSFSLFSGYAHRATSAHARLRHAAELLLFLSFGTQF